MACVQRLPDDVVTALGAGLEGPVREALARHGPGVLNGRSAAGFGVFGLELQAPDMRMVDLLLDLGADPARDPTGVEVGELTVLQELIWRSELALARRVVAAGAQVDTVSRGGSTALGIAVRDGLDEEASFLLSVGADPNAQMWDGESALHQAVEDNNAEMVTQLLRAGADPEWRNAQGMTSLMWAAMDTDRACCEALLSGGADPCAEDPEGRRAGDCAGGEGGHPSRAALAEFLREAARSAAPGHGRGEDVPGVLPGDVLRAIRDADLDGLRERFTRAPERLAWRSPQGQSVLMVALRAGRPESFHALVDLGADLRMPGWVVRDAHCGEDRAGAFTLLQQAIILDDEEVIARLLAGGAALDERNDHGETALHIATRSGSQRGVDALLGAGADPNIETDDGDVALGLAPLGGPQRVAALLEAGADPHILTAQGDTLLVHYAREGMLPACEMLMGFGARLRAEDNNGRCPAAAAREAGHAALADYLASLRRAQALRAEGVQTRVTGAEAGDFGL